jgi:hypothetical protein
MGWFGWGNQIKIKLYWRWGLGRRLWHGVRVVCALFVADLLLVSERICIAGLWYEMRRWMRDDVYWETDREASKQRMGCVYEEAKVMMSGGNKTSDAD